MQNTHRLDLPLVAASQAQKHVTVNEALSRLDILVQPSALSRSFASPPTTAQEGQLFLVASPATGEWSGHEHHIAVRSDQSWTFHPPRTGWTLYIQDENRLLAWDSQSWTQPAAAQDTPYLSINGGAADETNRLSIAGNATLFSHDGGDHRLTINKANTTATASVVYQSEFSGRAEIGLAGDEDLRIKVSPNGSDWIDSILIRKEDGRVVFPGGGVRAQLTADRTLFVRKDGHDDNDGLLDTPSGAFLTIQRAIDEVASLDLGAHNITVQIGSGLYQESVVAKTFLGAGDVVLKGDPVAPGNVIIESSGDAFSIDRVIGHYVLDGITLNGAARCIWAANNSILSYRNVHFDGPNVHVQTQFHAMVQFEAYSASTITATSFNHHIFANMGGLWAGYGATLTLPASSFTIGGEFVRSQFMAKVNCGAMSFPNGSNASGKSHHVYANAILYRSGTTIPGDVAGTIDSGGVVV